MTQMLAEPPLALEQRRSSGAYYTQLDAAHMMVAHVAASRPLRILEPSFGGGSFLQAIRDQIPSAEVTGVEIAAAPIQAAVGSGLIEQANAMKADFLGVQPFAVDAVVGNPPYVRLRNLPVEQMRAAQEATASVLGQPMEPSGSLWMPFVLHASRFLTRGGKLAFVLPWELTHVRYARPLWQYLGRSFGAVSVVRFRERVFPDLLQDVVLLFADDFGGTTDTVDFTTFDDLSSFRRREQRTCARISISNLLRGEREFTKGLLPPATRDLLDREVGASMNAVRERAVFNIGYVAGDKDFFHPSPSIIHEYKLPARSLRPAAKSARRLRGVGLCTSAIEDVAVNRLFHPDPEHLTQGEQGYVAWGEASQVDQRYKCRVRDPWYVVPGVVVPDLLLTVFSSDPLMMVNDGGLVASNSLLCGRLVGGTIEDFTTAWYTSLTRLHLETQVHSLGGGVLILIPGEVGRVLMPTLKANKRDLAAIDHKLRNGDIAGAYASGDHRVFGPGHAFTLDDRECVAEGIRTLQEWRTR